MSDEVNAWSGFVARPVVLCILDGWGHRDDPEANAPKLANTPHFDEILATCPRGLLTTHGPDVGLPSGQMGNSEVGHTNIGAGRVVAMDLGQIDLCIEDGSFFRNHAILEFADEVIAACGAAHLMGLASPGGVHSHQDHLVAAAKLLAERKVPTCVHIITDGRDVPPKSAREQVERLVAALPQSARIASVSGRYFAMDRDCRWDRTAKAFEAVVHGNGETKSGAVAAIEAGYGRGETDEFLTPTVIGDQRGIRNGDGVFFINFRADRARQLLQAIGEPGFSTFDVGRRPKLSALLGMVDYSEAHSEYMTAAYPKKKIINTLGSWVARHGLRQFRLAETEKYPHVTFFLNGGTEAPEEGEDRYMAPSPNVATYDLKPEMSTPEVSDRLVTAIGSGYDLIVVNFANPDMVGHTGDLSAAMKACEAVDEGLGRAIRSLESIDGTMIVTADHGNCEVMLDPVSGGPHTSHTTNPVDCVIVGGPDGAKVRDGRLADLAPTVLDIMGLKQPPEMTGMSLLVR